MAGRPKRRARLNPDPRAYVAWDGQFWLVIDGGVPVAKFEMEGAAVDRFRKLYPKVQLAYWNHPGAPFAFSSGARTNGLRGNPADALAGTQGGWSAALGRHVPRSNPGKRGLHGLGLCQHCDVDTTWSPGPARPAVTLVTDTAHVNDGGTVALCAPCARDYREWLSEQSRPPVDTESYVESWDEAAHCWR